MTQHSLHPTGSGNTSRSNGRLQMSNIPRRSSASAPNGAPAAQGAATPNPLSPSERSSGSQNKTRSGQSDGQGYDTGEDAEAYEMSTMTSHTGTTQARQPLLFEDKPPRYRSRSPSHVGPSNRASKQQRPEDQTRRKYMYAALCLIISLISFVVQTETAVYIQHELHWNKAYCMLWLTHGSWTLLYPMQLIFLRLANRRQPWAQFWRRHKALLRTTAQMIYHQDLRLSSSKLAVSPVSYIAKTTVFVTCFLTFAGASWYVAVNLTSPSDLTAIYNCSAFFAYVFSILLLKEKARLDKIFSVGLAIIGVLWVAYGDSESPHPKTPGHSGGSTNPNPNPDNPPDNRLAGNLIIGIGSVLYGLYEVLYKKYACPPEGTSPTRGMIFANTFGSCIGIFTVTILWIPIPILHYTGLETFELPRGRAASLLAISTLSNAIFSGSFLVLMSLTSPVLSSVAALLTIFLVAITDWLLTGKQLSFAAIGGGSLIIVAFLMLSFATYKEMQEDARHRAAAGLTEGDADDDDGEGGSSQYDSRQVFNADDRRSDDFRQVGSGEESRSGYAHAGRGRRSNSTTVVRGDLDDDFDDDDDFLDEEVLTNNERRHRES